jgi:toxin ParE1/3/4
MPRIAITPAADRDLEEQAVYIGRDNFAAAVRFTDAANVAFRQLAEMPRMGSVRETRNPNLKGLRTWRIPGFEKHLVFYRMTEEGIEVVRVLHGARDIPQILEAEGGESR